MTAANDIIFGRPSNAAEIYELGAEPRHFQIQTFLGPVTTTVRVDMEEREMKPTLEAYFHERPAHPNELSALNLLLAAAAELATPAGEHWTIATWQSGRDCKSLPGDRKAVHVYVDLDSATVPETWRAFKLLERVASGAAPIALPSSVALTPIPRTADKARKRKDSKRSPPTELAHKSNLLEHMPELLGQIFARYVPAQAFAATVERETAPQIKLQLDDPLPYRVRNALLHMIKAAIEARSINEQWTFKQTWDHEHHITMIVFELFTADASEAARAMRVLEAVIGGQPLGATGGPARRA